MGKVASLLVCIGVFSLFVRRDVYASEKDSGVEFESKVDFRLRNDYLNEQGSSDRNRWRYRLRGEGVIVVSPSLLFDARVASGSSDAPTSRNDTFDDASAAKPFWVDRAYLEYNFKYGNVLAGKVKNPTIRVGKNQLMYDGDFNPDGVGGVFHFPIASLYEVVYSAGAYVLDERSSLADSYLLIQQVGFMVKTSEDSALLVGVGYHDGLKLKNNVFLREESLGNTSSYFWEESRYEYDFNMLEGFAEYSTKLFSVPFLAYANSVVNLAAPSGRNFGGIVGLNVGKTKFPGGWSAGASYTSLDSDAVLSVLKDSDNAGGRTNMSGVTVDGGYKLNQWLTVKCTGFVAKYDARQGDLYYRRLQSDLVSSIELG